MTDKEAAVNHTSQFRGVFDHFCVLDNVHLYSDRSHLVFLSRSNMVMGGLVWYTYTVYQWPVSSKPEQKSLVRSPVSHWERPLEVPRLPHTLSSLDARARNAPHLWEVHQEKRVSTTLTHKMWVDSHGVIIIIW